MRRLGCLFALVLLSACSMTPSPASPSPQQSRFATTDPFPSPSVPSGTPTTLTASQQAAIENDLRGRGETAAVVVVSAEKVTFNDGSLGCPRPGVQYTQALVDGMRVIVEAGGRRYDYRFGNGDVPVLCEPTRPGAASSTR